jgi:antitoxin ParD1/3/4
MNIMISAETGDRLDRHIRSGRFQSAEEVIRSSLDLLESEIEELPASARSVAELEARLREGIEELDRGEWVEGDVALAQLRAALAQPRGA